MTTRAQLVEQVTTMYQEIKAARAAGNLDMVNTLERLAPQIEIAIGPLCRCEVCLKCA